MQLDIDINIVTSDQWQEMYLLQKELQFFNKMEKRVVKVCNGIWCFVLKCPKTFDADNKLVPKINWT